MFVMSSARPAPITAKLESNSKSAKTEISWKTMNIKLKERERKKLPDTSEEKKITTPLKLRSKRQRTNSSNEKKIKTHSAYFSACKN